MQTLVVGSGDHVPFDKHPNIFLVNPFEKVEDELHLTAMLDPVATTFGYVDSK